MKKARKNTYRLSFTIGGARRELYVHTQSEKNSVSLHVKKLISSRRTGAPALESEEWAQLLPKGNVREFLVRWGLLADTRDNERTLADLYQVFVVDGKGKDRTIINRKAAADRLSDFFGEGCKLQDINRQKVGDFINYLEIKGNLQTGKGLGQNTVVSIVKRCKLFFRYAHEEGWIKENPFTRFTATYKPCPDRWRYISQSDAVKVIEGTANREHRLIIALARFCGLRGASELSRLTFDESCLHLSRDGEAGELLVHSTKVEGHAGHETRPIPLTRFVEKLILDVWEHAPTGENRFFPNMQLTSNPGIIVKKAFNRVGVELGQMYNLRRSYATDLMQGGLHETDPKMFELLAGHDLAMSLTHYQIVSDSRKEKATGKFLEIMGTCTEAERNTTIYTTLPHVLQHRNNSQQLTTNENNNGLSLENKRSCEAIKKPCELSQGVNLPPRGVEPL